MGKSGKQKDDFQKGICMQKRYNSQLITDLELCRLKSGVNSQPSAVSIFSEDYKAIHDSDLQKLYSATTYDTPTWIIVPRS
jgi:hypothetical protein